MQPDRQVVRQIDRQSDRLEDVQICQSDQTDRQNSEHRGRRIEVCTRVQSDAYLHFDLWHVPNLKGSDAMQDVQRHVGYFCSVACPVSVGDA